MTFTEQELDAEAERLLRALMHVECDARRQWNLPTCRSIAPLTLEINRLKKEKGAIILAHSYVEPEIIYGVADAKGDSYFLSLAAKKSQAPLIVFAGVVFMAETAKILCPDATVVVPDHGSGCSLADSITAEHLRKLKSLYPDAVIVCYINSTAAATWGVPGTRYQRMNWPKSKPEAAAMAATKSSQVTAWPSWRRKYSSMPRRKASRPMSVWIMRTTSAPFW